MGQAEDFEGDHMVFRGNQGGGGGGDKAPPTEFKERTIEN